MFENVSNQFLSFGKQFAENSFKVQLMALESAERLADLQMKSLESRVNATVAFLGEASEVRDFDGVKTIWPRGVSLVKESTEQFVNTQQEVLGHGMKTSEALGQLVRAQFEAVNEGVAKHAKASRPAAAAAK